MTVDGNAITGSTAPNASEGAFSSFSGSPNPVPCNILRYEGPGSESGDAPRRVRTGGSGGLDLPMSMAFRETDPGTLNDHPPAATIVARAQPLAGATATSTPGLPSVGIRPVPAAVPASLWKASRPWGGTIPSRPSAPESLPAPSSIIDLPTDAPSVDSSLPARKSRSAADRILAGLDIGRLLDPSAVTPADAPR